MAKQSAKWVTAKTFYGAEPKFKESSITPENYKSEILKALNWYSVNAGKNHRTWFYAWAKTRGFTSSELSGIPTDRLTTLGNLSRIVMRGFPLNDADKSKMSESLLDLGITYEKVKPKVTKLDTRMKELRKLDHEDKLVGHVFFRFDSIIDKQLESTKQLKAPSVNCSKLNVSQMNEVKDYYAKSLSELKEAFNSGDPEIVEAYEVYDTKTANNKYLRLLIKLLEGINEELVNQELLKFISKPTKKCKTKVKTPEELTKKVKYLKESEDPKLKSVPVEKLVGASQVYIFNTKDRKLHYYFAPAGITVKGSTMSNFDSSKSYAKRIRKPEVFLNDLLKAPKVRSAKQLETVKAVSSKLTGRINAHCIILKVYS